MHHPCCLLAVLIIIVAEKLVSHTRACKKAYTKIEDREGDYLNHSKSMRFQKRKRANPYVQGRAFVQCLTTLPWSVVMRIAGPTIR